WQWVLGVNLWGVIHGVEAFVPRMIARGEPAHIVNTASMAGLIASKGLGVYNTSKYAVVGLSETLVKDLKPHRIGVSVLCPLGVAPEVSLDTEGDSLHHYPERLSLVQLATPDGVWLVDPLALPDLTPLAPVFAEHSPVVVVHAGDNDLSHLKRRYGFAFRSIFDTSIAARFLGGTSLGLDTLITTWLGITLPPSRQRDDWSARPLTPAQLDYAAADVRHL